MRVIIIANGEFNQPLLTDEGDLLIAADGGARHCLQAGVCPEVVIGDLDSLDAQEIKQLEQMGSQLIRHPRRKDFTDLELALRYAQEQGAEEILLLGALGNRWDQTIANILVLASISTIPTRLMDRHQEMFVIHPGQEARLEGQAGDIVSLIPIGGDAHGISTQNLEYPLQGESLLFGSTRGISNQMLKSQARVTLTEGMLLCTMIHN